MDGWVKLHRKILISDMYRSLTCKQKVVLFTLLLMANHQPRKWEYRGEIYELKPGQMITSISKIIALSADSELTVQMVRTTLLKLERWGFLTNQSTKTHRLITLVNWDFYQKDVNELTNDLTVHQQTNHKEVTRHSPSTHKETTTNKNEKKEKNEKNGKNIRRSDQSEIENPIFNQIKQQYLSWKDSKSLTTRDRQAIQQILDQGVPVQEILIGIDYAFQHFQPKHAQDRIQSFAYCAKVILDQSVQKERGSLERDQRSYATSSGEEDPFTDYLKNSYYAPVVVKE